MIKISHSIVAQFVMSLYNLTASPQLGPAVSHSLRFTGTTCHAILRLHELPCLVIDKVINCTIRTLWNTLPSRKLIDLC